MTHTDLKPLSFRQVSHNELRPQMFDNDQTRANAYCIGDLIALWHAPGAVRFMVAFRRGPGVREDGPPLNGEAEFSALRAGQTADRTYPPSSARAVLFHTGGR